MKTFKRRICWNMGLVDFNAFCFVTLSITTNKQIAKPRPWGQMDEILILVGRPEIVGITENKPHDFSPCKDSTSLFAAALSKGFCRI